MLGYNNNTPHLFTSRLVFLLIDYDGGDYVSELLSPTGILFIPRVICEHGEPW
jgi:hypothetical protein